VAPPGTDMATQGKETRKTQGAARRTVGLARWLLAWTACIAALWVFPAAAIAAEVPGSPGVRRALVIGNAAYRTLPLANPENDARLIASKLRTLGFEVEEHLNLGSREFRRVLRAFLNSLYEKEGVAVFYYAGHGVQIEGRNYLLPVDINPQSEYEVKDDSVDIDEIFVSRLEGARAQARIIILDACRNDPFPKRRTRNLQIRGGLAEMAARGTLIAYASAPGATAEDGPEGANSVYTKHLAEEMSVPGLEVEQMFKNVRVKVLRDTQERQVPWVNTSLTVNFSFNPRTGPDPAELARQERVRKLEKELASTRELLEQARLRMIEVEARQPTSTVAIAAPPGAPPPAQSAGLAPSVPSASLEESPPAAARPTQAAAAPAPPTPAPAASAAPTAATAAMSPPAVAIPPAAATAPATAAALTTDEAIRREFFRLQDQVRAAEEALLAARADAEAKTASAEPLPVSTADYGIRGGASISSARQTGRGKANQCSELLSRLSLGESLSDDHTNFLRRECK